jgi:endonuclease-3
MVGFGQTVCLPRVPKCGECKLADEGLCPFARKGIKAWREREAKKVKVKQEIKQDIDAVLEIADKVETDLVESSPKLIKSEISTIKVETSPLKPIKEEVISGYHIEHFSLK